MRAIVAMYWCAMRSSKLSPTSAILYFDLNEPVPLYGEDRDGVAHPDQNQRKPMVDRRGEDGLEKSPGFLHGMPVEQLGAQVARFDTDAMPRGGASGDGDFHMAL
jgi:hypothetical protein